MIPVVPINEAAWLNPRTPRELSTDSEREVHFLPMANVSEEGAICLNGTRSLGEVIKGYTYFRNGDILIAKITPCMENGKAAFVEGLALEVGFGSTEFHVLRPKPGVSGRYLFFMVWNPWFRKVAESNMTGTAGQKRVPSSFFDSFKIPLPPEIDEQERIASILDKANVIRRKRQQQVEIVGELIHSAFIEIVGPKAHGYRTWKPRRIDSLASSNPGSMRTGPFGSDLKHSEFVENGIAVLGIDNAVQNQFAWSERRFITVEKFEKLHRYRVYPGDVIITIMGTTGRSAVVPDDIPVAITTKHLATITLDREQAEPEFISNAIHRHPEVLRQIRSSNRGAIMDGLNLGLIRSLEVPVPPLTIQREFVIAVDKIRKLGSRINRALEESDRLFNSLVSRAFRGEL